MRISLVTTCALSVGMLFAQREERISTLQEMGLQDAGKPTEEKMPALEVVPAGPSKSMHNEFRKDVVAKMNVKKEDPPLTKLEILNIFCCGYAFSRPELGFIYLLCWAIVKNRST